MAGDILRGKVTAYPGEEHKGTVEVALGAFHQEGDRVRARVEHSLPGVYALPEIGDVVEVEVSDRPGRPARVVRVRRGEDDPQTAACWTEENDIKQLRTRAGHTVTLDDTRDKTSITLRTAGGLELRLEDEGQTVTVGTSGQEDALLRLDTKKGDVALTAGKKLTVSCAGSSLAFDGQGNLSVEVKGKLTLSAREIALDAKAKLAAKGQQVEAAGSLSAKLSGQSSLELSSGGVTQVKGGLIKLN